MVYVHLCLGSVWAMGRVHESFCYLPSTTKILRSVHHNIPSRYDRFQSCLVDAILIYNGQILDQGTRDNPILVNIQPTGSY